MYTTAAAYTTDPGGRKTANLGTVQIRTVSDFAAAGGGSRKFSVVKYCCRVNVTRPPATTRPASQCHRVWDPPTQPGLFIGGRNPDSRLDLALLQRDVVLFAVAALLADDLKE